MSKEIKEYDKNNNKIHQKHSTGFEYWCKFDENNNEIHCKNNHGQECWYKYDENNKEIYYKNIYGNEVWYKRENNKRVEITKQEFKQIERTKERKELYFNNKKCSRFELMDI